MKKAILTFALCLSASAFAQVLDVASIEKLATPQGVVAGISPQGDYVLVTNATNDGLSKYDMKTGATTVVTDARGAGRDVKIAADGQSVVYRELTFKNHLRDTEVKQANLATGEKKQLVKPSRNIEGVAIDNAAAVVVNKGKASAKALGATKAKAAAPVLSIKNRQLMITDNGKTRTFSPNGQQFSYIWPSLSPDGNKVLYYVCGRGAYVADLKGHIIAELGQIRAPKWYNDEIVVGMNDKDNGEVVTSSSIVAATLYGVRQTLTDSSVIAMYPYTNGEKIAFSTANGEAYVININLKK